MVFTSHLKWDTPYRDPPGDLVKPHELGELAADLGAGRQVVVFSILSELMDPTPDHWKWSEGRWGSWTFPRHGQYASEGLPYPEPTILML